MSIKKGDKVKIIAGKDNDKSGKVLQVFKSENRASVEGVNILIKHLRPRRQGDKGQRVEFPAPLSISNMMVICPKCGKPTRIGSKVSEVEGKTRKYRICRKCKEVID